MYNSKKTYKIIAGKGLPARRKAEHLAQLSIINIETAIYSAAAYAQALMR